MKFGRNLPRNQVPEWASAYINYKGLKKLIKAAASTAKDGKDVDLAEFFFVLDRNLEDVDNFYNKRFAESSRRLKLLDDRYGRSDNAGLDSDEVDELMGALLEVRGQLRKLQWFGEVNRRGFRKITKKLDKKVPDISTQEQYVEAKVNPKSFATNSSLFATLKRVNEWLSELRETKDVDETTSAHAVPSMKRVSSVTMLALLPEMLINIEKAIKLDDDKMMEVELSKIKPDSESLVAKDKLLVRLLQRCVVSKSKDCIKCLLCKIQSLDDDEDINSRNCLHRLVISIGRLNSSQIGPDEATLRGSASAEDVRYITPAAHPLRPPRLCNNQELHLMDRENASVKVLILVLEHMLPSQRSALSSKDSYGRLPLHYAAQYGVAVVCEILMRYMQDWGQFSVENGVDALEWQDNEGHAPLHLSVIGGHTFTTKALLQCELLQQPNSGKATMRRQIAKSSAVLTLATRANFTTIVELLVAACVDINWQDETGETALHVAARYGNSECAKHLLNGNEEQTADLEVVERTFGWTPLHVACVDGQLTIVELLLAAGADPHTLDTSGWTAQEHAALRGHFAIAERLAEDSKCWSTSSESEGSGNTPGTSPSTSSPIKESRLYGSRATGNAGLKSFGHRYLTDESMVLVSLGSMDVRKNIEAVKLDQIPMTEAHATELDTALSLVVSAVGAKGDETIIDLPLDDRVCTEPLVFRTPDPSRVKLLFDIVPTYSGNEKHKIGRGVALLNSIKPTIGLKRMNLQGDVSVPVIGTNLEVLGIVNFNFLVVTPFSHPNMEITENQTYWKTSSSTMVIGHRGLGKNVTSNRSLQLGENTIQSFITAANLGANYVEFDVQVTKDHVPVIYHDFLVSETGIDAPVHTMTLEQFLHINKQSKQSSRAASPDRKKEPLLDRIRNDQGRQRSYSVGHGTNETEMDDRMKHTRDFKEKGYKANTRGNFIQAPFTTLEEMFQQVPESVGFNIEMKYPMLFESEEQDMDTYAVELNSFCDTVLTKVYDLGRKRNIIFSSFHPDICLLLSLKQPSIPILFLTDAGTSEVGDVRASSLQEAIRFASKWNLLGVVSAAGPFCNSPRLVRVVKESGLVCVSYGTLNNDTVMVQRQVDEGIDAVIVDNVLAIRKGLTEKGVQK